MEIVKSNILLFFRMRLISVLIIGFTIVSVIYLVYYYFQYYQTLDIMSIVSPLGKVLSLSIYVFAIFLIASYEYFSKSKRVNLDETFLATPSGKVLFISKFIVLVSCSIVITAIFFLYAVMAFHAVNLDAPKYPYYFHIMVCIFVYIFLIALCAILLGAVISFIRKRLLALAIILLVILLISPLFEAIAMVVNLTRGVNIFPVMNFFGILPINLNWTPNFSTGYVVSPEKIFLIVFWIFAMLTICISYLCQNHRKLITGIGITVCALSLIGYSIPSSMVRMNEDPNGTAMHDQYYYAENQGTDEPADYKITAYNIKIKIGRTLYAEAELSFDSKKDSYQMTLYHGYEITAAYDQTGEELVFLRDNDYVTVFSKDTTEKIIIKYCGYSPRYYSNGQGAFLPGYFAYYPRTGFIDMANDDDSDIRQVFSEYKSNFNITVSCKQPIFSNIKDVGGNTFCGETNGVTLYSGFLKEIENDSLRVIYPYLYDECTRKNIDKLCDELVRDRIHDCTIFITPSLNEFWDGAQSDNQILSRSVVFSVNDLENQEMQNDID